jgi:pyruvate,water dikinase
MRLLHASHNLLTAMLPEYEHLAHAIRVIDVPTSSDGRILRVLMNSELDEAIALLAEAGECDDAARSDRIGQPRQHSESYWRWRMQMSEKIASEIDPDRFAVKAVYIIGSTKNANAGPSSDIDLLIHFRGNEGQRHDLEMWLEGWSLCLGEINYLRTGYVNPDLLDVHIITDEDIEKGTSFAAKIDAVTDAALELPLGKQSK